MPDQWDPAVYQLRRTERGRPYVDLIARIGAEFGISIVVASHLLGEIERICDHLVAIEAGKLLRADSITSMTQVSQVLIVDVDDGSEELLAELGRRGLEPRRQERSLLVALAGDATYDIVRDAIADLALPLNRLEQRRRRVEELFAGDDTPDALAGAGAGGPGGIGGPGSIGGPSGAAEVPHVG